jgi:hypothetical protein
LLCSKIKLPPHGLRHAARSKQRPTRKLVGVVAAAAASLSFNTQTHLRTHAPALVVVGFWENRLFLSLSLTLSLTRSLPLLLVLFCRLYNILVAWRSGVSVKVRCPGEREARARRCVCCYCSRSAEEAVTILYAVWLLEPGLSDQFQGEPVSLLQSRRGAESSISVRPQQREQAGERATQ